MKKKAIITYILALALFLSACVYTIPENTESTPSSSDTSPSSSANPDTLLSGEYSIRHHISSKRDTIDGCNYGQVILTINGQQTIGMALLSCEEDVKEVIIPEEVCGYPVVAIGDTGNVFGPDHSVEKIVMPDTVQYISNFAFKNCTTLTDLTLSSQIKFIGAWAFENCPGLRELRITPDMKLNYQSIVEATGLEKVIIEEGATFVPFFTGCSSLKEIQLPSTITALGMDGSDGNEPHFWGTQITFVELPEGLTYLGWYVFMSGNIESIVLPSTLTEVYTDTFDAESLKYVFFRGTEDQLLDEVRETIHAPIYFYSETEPTEDGNFWHYVDGQPVIW